MTYKINMLAGFIAMIFLSTALSDEPAKKPTTAVPQDELTKEAEAAIEELKSSFPDDSEPMAMLKHILAGSRLSGGDGWFKLAVPQSRFDWANVRAAYDTDGDDRVSSKELSVSQSDFIRVDRDGDGSVTAADFDWSENANLRSPGHMLFMQADHDANGKVTADEFAELFKTLDGGEQGFLSLDEVRESLQPRLADSPERRADRPNRSTLIMGLKRQEIGSLQPGPSLDEPAPDFTLKSLAGDEVTLSQEVGDKPIVLIFGNFTCGPFRSQSGNIEKLYERYKDRAKFFMVYVREAHPKDGWWMTSNQRVGIDIMQPQNDRERRAVAETCQKHLKIEMPFLVDRVDDKVGATYSGMPNRLYLIDRDGKIAFKNGRGPFGFHPRQLEQALILMLDSTSAGK